MFTRICAPTASSQLLSLTTMLSFCSRGMAVIPSTKHAVVMEYSQQLSVPRAAEGQHKLLLDRAQKRELSLCWGILVEQSSQELQEVIMLGAG